MGVCVSTSFSTTLPSLLFFPHFLSTSSLLCLLCIILSISLPVLRPLTGTPYRLPLNENAANSFADNQCRRYTKERTKLFYCSPESFLVKQLLERRLELGRDVKKGGEGGRVNIRGRLMWGSWLDFMHIFSLNQRVLGLTSFTNTPVQSLCCLFFIDHTQWLWLLTTSVWHQSL